MDKRIILAVAGAGKTTHIIKQLDLNKRSLILTYTVANHKNLRNKILANFEGEWPPNITLMRYFKFLYSFCYKPLLADKVRARGIIYTQNPNRYARKDYDEFYLTASRYFYSNRLSFYLSHFGHVEEIKERIVRYFDELIIDEIQDIAGRDFNFILEVMESNINMLFVGDFYQHTFDTSRDGLVNKNLFDDIDKYKDRFIAKKFTVDEEKLNKSWRCNKAVCDFIRENLNITMYSHHEKDQSCKISHLTDKDKDEIERVMQDGSIVKLHYQNSSKYGPNHKNWGETKGEDCYQDVCVMLNKTTKNYFIDNSLCDLAPTTRNKLYVALTRARGNIYFISESTI